MNEICRICRASAESVSLVGIFDDQQNQSKPWKLEPTLVEQLNECFHCQIQYKDALPQNVCLECVVAAKNASRPEMLEVKMEPELRFHHENELEESEDDEPKQRNPEPAPEPIKQNHDVQDSDDKLKLRKLLRSFDLENLFQCLQACGVTYRCLKYISKYDIKEAIPHNIGFRAEFREKLFKWRRKEFHSDDETPSVSSKVKSWLQCTPATCSTTPIPTNTTSDLQVENGTKFHLNIRTILQNCSKGRSLLSYYSKTSQLTNNHREQLISIIVDEANCSDMLIKNTDYPMIIRQIVSIFPTEAETKEFYFIPRASGKNPSGKLYAKYRNARSKRKKLNSVPDHSSFEQSIVDNSSLQMDNNLASSAVDRLENEYDSTLAMAYKAELQRAASDWQNVLDKWSKTFHLRRRDLDTYDIGDFLQEWPKLGDHRAVDLISMDFNLLHPDKTFVLANKWELFKKQILPYYQANVHNVNSRQLLAELQYAQSPDSSDYILAVLLPSVLPPTSWHKVKAGEPKRKITLLDSQDSFVLRLPKISDAPNLVNSCAIQPCIIVEGRNSYSLQSFYVHFDKTLFKRNSFLDCLDTSLKIFNIFNLKYPIASELPWLFIQKFFYEIDTCYDAKSANLTAIMSFLKSSINYSST